MSLTQTFFQANLFNHLDVRARAQDARFVRVFPKLLNSL
jgi:hypothetical protein